MVLNEVNMHNRKTTEYCTSTEDHNIIRNIFVTCCLTDSMMKIVPYH